MTFANSSSGRFNLRRVAYKFPMYPDDTQAALIRRTFGCVRFVWNQMLEAAKTSYAETKKFTYPTPAKFKPLLFREG